MTETQPATTRGAPRRAAIAFIFITVVLDVLAIGIIIPVLPKLVEAFRGGDTASAARIFGVFGTAWALMQFFFSPVLGALSDRYGRRPVILASNFGLGLDFVMMALAPNLIWLFIGRVISGITGASFTTAGAYIADVTPPDKRAAGYGMMGAAWGLGFVLGPALGGVLGSINPRLPFWVAACLTLINATYGYFILPESLGPEQRTPFSWKRANPLGSLKLLRSHTELLGLAGVNFLYNLAHQVLPSVFVLFAGYRYGWDERAVGFLLAAVGVCGIVVQGALVKPVVAKLGDRRALLVGATFGVLGFAAYGFASTEHLVWFAVPILALMGFYSPAAASIMSKRVGATDQGLLQGANSSIMGISGMIGPALFTQTFAFFISPGRSIQHPGAPFLAASLLMVIALMVAWRVTKGPSDLSPEPLGATA
jgi:DHA1 family tetracycline resistance protein-like MFS transporter